MSDEASTAIDPDVALFASYMREQADKEKADKRAAREARAEADQVQTLVAAKDAAAAEVKRLRGREGVSAEERTAADVAYREALAAVVAAETGEAPTWAPPAPPDPEPAAEADAESAEVEATDTEPHGGDTVESTTAEVDDSDNPDASAGDEATPDA